MMTKRIASKEDKSTEQKYFLWLCDLVRVGRPGLNRREFVWSLHQKEFFWSVPNDNNRGEDGKSLRMQFAEETGNKVWLYGEDPYLERPSSVFEMLVALAIRMEYNLQDLTKKDRTAQWFWEMIENLDLLQFKDNDSDIREKISANNNILENFLKRRYSTTGKGGLFPLKSVTEPQQKVEIWYQMMKYLDENYEI